MSSEERKFEQVLDSLAEKEKRAQKRATLLTALTLGVGLLLMAILFYQIVRLNHLKGGLQQEIGTLRQDIDKLKEEKRLLDVAVETRRAEAVNLLTETQADLKKDNVDAALNKITEGLRTLEGPKNARDVAETSRPKISTQGPGDEARVSIATNRPGFRSDYHYIGHDKTKITITVRPEAVNKPDTLFTWSLDGKSYFKPPPNETITFALDKQRRNPSIVVLFLNFRKGEPGGFAITVETGDGSRRYIHVPELLSGGERQRTFEFGIL